MHLQDSFFFSLRLSSNWYANVIFLSACLVAVAAGRDDTSLLYLEMSCSPEGFLWARGSFKQSLTHCSRSPIWDIKLSQSEPLMNCEAERTEAEEARLKVSVRLPLQLDLRSDSDLLKETRHRSDSLEFMAASTMLHRFISLENWELKHTHFGALAE